MDFQTRILEIDKELTALEGAIGKRKQEREALVVLSGLQKDAFDVVLRPKNTQSYGSGVSTGSVSSSAPSGTGVTPPSVSTS
jgi:hypothetical protein